MANNWEINYSPQDLLPARGSLQGATLKAFATTSTNRPAFAFDDTTLEAVSGAPFIAPENTDAGTIKCELKISAESDVTNTAAFSAGLECVTDGDSLSLQAADSIGSQSVGSVTLSGTAGDQHKIEITISDTDGIAAGDQVRLVLSRDAPTTDPALDDVYLWSARLYQEAT